MKYVAFAIFIFIVFSFYLGIVHLAFRFSLNDEKDKPHYSSSTNGKEAFTMKIDSVGNYLYHKKVTGRFKGELPKYGDILLLDNGLTQKPVKTLFTKKGSYDYETNSFELTISLFGASEKMLGSSCVLTNIRKSENITVHKAIKKSSNVKLDYPVVVKSSTRDYFNCAFILLIGLVMLPMTVLSIIYDTGFSFPELIVLVVGLAFTALGVKILYWTYKFKIQINEDGSILVISSGKTNEFNFGEYSYSLRVERSNNKEGYLLHIMDLDKKVTYATIPDTNPNFAKLYAALRNQ